MLKIVNRTIPQALTVLGYSDKEISDIVAYIEKTDTIEGAPHLRKTDLPVFDCAFPPANGSRSIHWQAHLKMMAAAQPFLSGAISKTINMPTESTKDDIMEAYMEGWQLGLKAVAIYRDGSKRTQPVNTGKQKSQEQAETKVEKVIVRKPFRKRLPDTRKSITHKFSVAGHEGYLTVGLYEDGQPGELFITMAKEGSTVGGLMDVVGTCVSMALQYGVPLITLVDKFRHARFEPAGMTSNKDIPFAKSLIDYIFCWMGCQFLPGYAEKNTPNRTPSKNLAPQNNASSSAAPATASPTAKGAASPASSANSANSPNSQSPSSPQGSSNLSNPINEATLRQALATVQASLQSSPQKVSLIQQFNGQFEHFQDDAPACDICGSITVRNGTCYRCYNCGNSMGCS